MKKIVGMAVVTAIGIVAPMRPAFAGNRPPEFQVVPFERNDTLNLVRSTWQKGIGCPNTSTDPLYNCRTDQSDTDDTLNQGLLLAKSGNGAVDPGQAGATLVGVQGRVIPSNAIDFEADPILGYDIRKDIFFGPNGLSTAGAHCGAPDLAYGTPASTGLRGSPRFEVQVNGRWYFIPCGEPTLFFQPSAGDLTAVPSTSNGWVRLRWPAAVLRDVNTGQPPLPVVLMGQPVSTVQIVFDAGPDISEAPSDQFGLAVLDNIFAWYRVEGDGSASPTHPPDEDEGAGEDKDHNSCEYRHSDWQPNRNKVGYYDPSQKMWLSSNNIRSATYQANCVNLVGDGLVNGKSGYTYTYQACDLATGLMPGIGTFNISISGPGLVYSKSAAMTSGFVYIHPHL